MVSKLLVSLNDEPAEDDKDKVNVNDIKIENIEESLEPAEVDIAVWRIIQRRDKRRYNFI